jgi:hypothetical protein
MVGNIPAEMLACQVVEVRIPFVSGSCNFTEKSANNDQWYYRLS